MHKRLGLLFATVLMALSPSGCGCFVPVDELLPDAPGLGNGGGIGGRGGGGGESVGGGGGSGGGFVDAGAGGGGGTAVLTARLPYGLHGAAAAWDGQQIWIFGGLTGSGVFSEAVLRFEPASETVQTTSFRLPYGRQASSAVASGGFIYLFGGRSSMTALMTQIVRFDPSTGSMTPMNSVLPTGRYNMGAVAIGNEIFLVGGYDYSKVREIIRFDPATDSLAVLPTQLSPGLESPVAVPFASAFFILGGSDSSGQRAQILRFETSTGGLSVSNSALPYAAWQPAPLVIDGVGYLCGGDSVTSVISFDPASGQASTMQGVTIGGASAMSSCTASMPGRGYIFGGYGPNGAFLDRIVRFVP